MPTENKTTATKLASPECERLPDRLKGIVERDGRVSTFQSVDLPDEERFWEVLQLRDAEVQGSALEKCLLEQLGWPLENFVLAVPLQRKQSLATNPIPHVLLLLLTITKNEVYEIGSLASQRRRAAAHGTPTYHIQPRRFHHSAKGTHSQLYYGQKWGAPISP